MSSDLGCESQLPSLVLSSSEADGPRRVVLMHWSCFFQGNPLKTILKASWYEDFFLHWLTTMSVLSNFHVLRMPQSELRRRQDASLWVSKSREAPHSSLSCTDRVTLGLEDFVPARFDTRIFLEITFLCLVAPLSSRTVPMNDSSFRFFWRHSPARAFGLSKDKEGFVAYEISSQTGADLMLILISLIWFLKNLEGWCWRLFVTAGGRPLLFFTMRLDPLRGDTFWDGYSHKFWGQAMPVTEGVGRWSSQGYKTSCYVSHRGLQTNRV